MKDLIMTEIFIDTEFNGFNGQLISMALVTKDGNEFYSVLDCKNPIEWVKNNVIPVLNQEPEIHYAAFQAKLQEYLMQFDEITLIADWPEDIKHFCQSLILRPGKSMNLPTINMVIDPNIHSIFSKIRHNALEDARAIRDEYYENLVS